ncbi:heterokaryon incompatibility protein-domain-containing protein [Phaeosphaeriaceae sp. PMI808]|nr:heterokaryon incompatibility protein-domain-containing protein [Phaeosphaeriaceae sp. PMI808]
MRCLCQNPGVSDNISCLCDDCSGLFAHDDVASILKHGMKLTRKPCDPTTSKCELCLFLSARYFKKSILFPNDDGGDNDFKVIRKVLSWLGGGKLTCQIRGDLKTLQPLEVERYDGWWPLKTRYFKVSARRNSPVADNIICRPVNTDLRSDGTYAMVKEWLTECDDHHDCFETLPLVKLPPTHLINVNHPVRRTLIRLGSSQSYMTTSRNYQSYQEGLSIASLGKGLQDTIWVTRKLGLQYLWIDALCIIQDSSSNKMQEIARMDSIYTFAYVTISASSAFSCTQSFLSTKPRTCIHRLSGIEIPLGSGGDKAHLRVMDRRDDGYGVNWQEELEPIHHRAWTFQEHFMSSRILLFKDFQLFWICTKTRGRDGGWMASDEEQSYGQQWNLSRRMMRSPVPSDWLTICRTYAGRKLTDPNDKLSALSSIASYFATTGSTSYAAGIWMSSFVDQLAWRAKSLGTTNRPKVWTAPSWSWASLNCPISFQSQDYDDRTTIPYLRPQLIKWHVEPFSEHSKFGQLKSACLQLSGRILKCMPKKHPDGVKRGYDLDLITADRSDIKDLGPVQLFFDHDIGHLPSDISTIQGIERWDSHIHCLLLRVEVNEQMASHLQENIVKIGDDKIEELFCLALRQLEGGEFYRVGFVAIHPDYRGKGWLAAFEQADERVITLV